MNFSLYAAWSINSFLTNFQNSLSSWGAAVVMIIGTVMVIGSAWHIGKGLLSQGKGQTNWALTILLLIVGGAFMATGGWTMLTNISNGSFDTINTLGSFALPFVN